MHQSLEDSQKGFSSAIVHDLKQELKEKYRENSFRSSGMASYQGLAFEGLKPLWETAKTDQVSDSVKLTRVLLNADVAYTRIPEGADSLQIRKYADQLSRVYLIHVNILEVDSSRKVFAQVLPDLEYLDKGGTLDTDKGIVPKGFDGTIFYYSLDGRTRNLFRYKGGRCHQQFEPEKERKEGLRSHWTYVTRCYWVKTIRYGKKTDLGSCPDVEVIRTKHCETTAHYVSSFEPLPGVNEGYGGGGGGGGSSPGGNSTHPLQSKEKALELISDPCLKTKELWAGQKFKDKIEEYSKWFRNDLVNDMTQENGFADFGNGEFEDLDFVRIPDEVEVDTKSAVDRGARGIIHTHPTRAPEKENMIGKSFEILSIKDYFEFLRMLQQSLEDTDKQYPAAEDRYLGLLTSWGEIHILRFISKESAGESLAMIKERIKSIQNLRRDVYDKLNEDYKMEAKKYGDKFERTLELLSREELYLPGLVLQNLSRRNGTIRTNLMYRDKKKTGYAKDKCK